MTTPCYLCPLINGTAQLTLNSNTGILQTNDLGNVYFYAANSATPVNTYQGNTTGTTQNQNPIQIPAGSGGQIGVQVWLPAGQNTLMVIEDVWGHIIDSQDALIGIDDPTYGTSVAGAAYTLGNAAFLAANTANTNAYNVQAVEVAAYTAANAAANTVHVYANGSSINAASNLNLVDSVTANGNVSIAIISGNLVLQTTNVGLDANLTALSLISQSVANANGWANLSPNIAVQWGSLYVANPLPVSVGGTTYTITFPVKFYSACYQLQAGQVSTDLSGAEESYVRIFANQLTHTNFTFCFDGFGTGAAPTTIYWWAVGNLAP